MFYPAECLRRGGRFYLCWVADSWPLRFRTLPRRALWAPGTDIRDICDGLMEVITQESGVPDSRFSLRLSSQLMRGVIRLYERKTNTFLGELCMLSAHIQVQINKKWEDPNEKVKRTRAIRDAGQQAINVCEAEELPEEAIAERIRNSGHIVANVEEITMREEEIPMRTLPNDNFGEEQPGQALQQLMQDLTIRAVLGQQDAGHLGNVSCQLDLQLDTTDKSRDISRLFVCDIDQMARISEVDISEQSVVPDVEMSVVNELLARDIAHPEIPEIQLHPAPVHLDENEAVGPAATAPTDMALNETDRQADAALAGQEIGLEALEEVVPTRSVRRLKRLVIDKQTAYGKEYMRSRIADDRLELRCSSACQDSRVDLATVPAEMLFRRMATGMRTRPNITYRIASLYVRNLAPVEKTLRADTESTQVTRKSKRSKDVLRKQNDIQNIQNITTLQANLEHTIEKDMEVEQEAEKPVSLEELEMSAIVVRGQVELVSGTSEANDRSSTAKRRGTEPNTDLAPKRPRASSRTLKSKQSENRQIMEELVLPPIAVDEETALLIPSITEEPVQPDASQELRQTRVSDMLQVAGLAEDPQRKGTNQNGSESEVSESLRGSLDRTKVSLGEYSEAESVKLMKAEWGVEGTIFKIIQSVKKGVNPLTLRRLVKAGPTTSNDRMATVRCFTSILKLKSAGFIDVVKNAETQEIEDILLGRKFAKG